jgi:hypothetical protein
MDCARLLIPAQAGFTATAVAAKRSSPRSAQKYAGLLFLALLFFAPIPALAQATASSDAAQGQKDAANPPLTLPNEFRGIKLGMGIEEVQGLLGKDTIFEYRGPEDVSLLPQKNQSLVEASGTSFVKRAFFQFVDRKLWVIILFLNPEKIDHYSVYSQLVSKYGEPSLLDPKEARWEDASIRMAIERPLTLRYMDMKVFAKLQAGGSAAAGVEELERRDFLGNL